MCVCAKMLENIVSYIYLLDHNMDVWVFFLINSNAFNLNLTLNIVNI